MYLYVVPTIKYNSNLLVLSVKFHESKWNTGYKELVNSVELLLSFDKYTIVSTLKKQTIRQGQAVS